MESKKVVICVFLICGVLSLVMSTSYPFPNIHIHTHHFVQPPPPMCPVGDQPLKTLSLHIQSKISFRYSITTVKSRVENPHSEKSQEFIFSVSLPETAFVSNFTIEVNGKVYPASVKEKEEARQSYDKARALGQDTGLVETSFRNSKLFKVKVNIATMSTVDLVLTYEELLSRANNQYQQIINIDKSWLKTAKDYSVEVSIEEPKRLSFVRVPFLNDKLSQNDTTIERPSDFPNRARIQWNPTQSSDRFKQFVNDSTFVVQYDVDREGNPTELYLNDGYFVHFFVPSTLPPLRKHVVFILDISGSMSWGGGRNAWGAKLAQMKTAMNKIVDDLSVEDSFNIVPFSHEITEWTINGTSQNGKIEASAANKIAAKVFISSLVASGGTDIHKALEKGIQIVAELTASRQLRSDIKPMIIFLTDGEPTSGKTNKPDILQSIQTANKANVNIPIFCLGFGTDVDLDFLKALSLQNYGFTQKIYEGADAALQLTQFYSSISTPVLSNVVFKYTSELYNVTDVSSGRFKTYFSGKDIAVVGKLSTNLDENIESPEDCEENSALSVKVKGTTRNKRTFSGSWDIHNCDSGSKSGEVTPSVSHMKSYSLERLWAYLTIMQLIEKTGAQLVEGWVRLAALARALELSLKYGFVTPLTSMVVVNPDSTSTLGDLCKAQREMRQQAEERRQMVYMRQNNDERSYSMHRARDDAIVPLSYSPSPVSPVHVLPHVPQAQPPMSPQVPLARPGPEVASTQDINAGEFPLKLGDVSWLNVTQNEVAINGTNYLVARQPVPTLGNATVSPNCTTILGSGKCQHLKDCVRKDFVASWTTYLSLFFCEIPMRTTLYAGVCCLS